MYITKIKGAETTANDRIIINKTPNVSHFYDKPSRETNAQYLSKLRDNRLANLSKGKVKGIGFYEGLRLKIAGRIDGSRGLPRNGGSGGWISPHIDKEVRAYEEFTSRMWGNLQIEEEEAYTRLGELMDSLAHASVQLKNAREEFSAMSAREGAAEVVRKKGEDKLTEAQVKVRRANEEAKRLAPLTSRISALQDTLAAEIDEFFELRNRILEDNNSTRMICNRVKDHILQRMDVYWNAALRKHPESSTMPTIPSVEMTSRAEELYMEPHAALMKKAESLSRMLAEDAEMEAAS